MADLIPANVDKRDVRIEASCYPQPWGRGSQWEVQAYHHEQMVAETSLNVESYKQLGLSLIDEGFSVWREDDKFVTHHHYFYDGQGARYLNKDEVIRYGATTTANH